MSFPSLLIVWRKDDKPVEVFLGSRPAEALFNYMLERMPSIAPEYAEEFEYSNWCVFSITGLPESSFMAVCDMMMQACEDLPALKPRQAALREALASDPRFQPPQAA